MKKKVTNLQTRLYLITAVILLCGFGSAIWIYLAAENNSDGAIGYETAGGYVYPVSPEDSKLYMHNLELYGGKVNVLANEMVRWFVGLWHGKSLAYTVACISVIISFGVFFVANHLPTDTKSDAAGGNHPDAPRGQDHP
jgi:hypothetical protein